MRLTLFSPLSPLIIYPFYPTKNQPKNDYSSSFRKGTRGSAATM